MVSKTKCGYFVDSFDRFGDDLCELLLSYLSVIDKIRFECVSKQWKSLIFNRQKSLQISSDGLVNSVLIKTFNETIQVPNNVNKTLFKSLFKKFKFIQVLEIRDFISKEVLNAITDNLNFLEMFCYSKHMCKSDLISFGSGFGQRLKFISLCANSDREMLALFRLTPNLEKVEITRISEEFFEIFLTKLKEITIKYVYSVEELKLFSDKYHKQVKKLDISPYFSSTFVFEDMNNCLTQLARYVSLESLSITAQYIFSLPINSSIDSGLIAIGKNCKKLKDFSLILGYISDKLITGELFDIFGNFHALEKLYIQFDSYIKNWGNVKSLEKCKNLKVLNLSLPLLSDKNFEGIDKYLPNLTKFLMIETNNGISNKTMYILAKLKKLNTITIISEQIDDLGFCHVINNCPNLRTIVAETDITDPNDKITNVSLKAFIEIALKNPKIEYRFDYLPYLVDLKEAENIVLPPNFSIY
jgi:hypothetical protein